MSCEVYSVIYVNRKLFMCVWSCWFEKRRFKQNAEKEFLKKKGREWPFFGNSVLAICKRSKWGEENGLKSYSWRTTCNFRCSSFNFVLKQRMVECIWLRYEKTLWFSQDVKGILAQSTKMELIVIKDLFLAEGVNNEFPFFLNYVFFGEKSNAFISEIKL